MPRSFIRAFVTLFALLAFSACNKNVAQGGSRNLSGIHGDLASLA
jgi:hypothetical protein